MDTGYNAATWLLDRHVSNGDGHRTALIHQDDQLTYETVQRASWRVQHALKDLAVRREERVVMVVNDEPAFVAWFLGCLRAGVVPVPLSTMLTADELGAIVDDAGAGLVVLSSAYAEHLAGIAKGAPDLRAAVVIGDADVGPPV